MNLKLLLGAGPPPSSPSPRPGSFYSHPLPGYWPGSARRRADVVGAVVGESCLAFKIVNN